MTETKILVGSLSNDLYRVASLAHRGSNQAAIRFLEESKKWSKQLRSKPIAPYIQKITQDISSRKDDDISAESVERYLMYGVLLQNYCLHIE